MSAASELSEILTVVRREFVVAALFFCAARCKERGVKTEKDLQMAISAMPLDSGVRQLPMLAQDELQRLIVDSTSSRVISPLDRFKRLIGGMNEGQSTGLRKWFSKHSKGLDIVSRLEAFYAKRTTVPLADWPTLRGLASAVLAEMRSKIPPWAQVIGPRTLFSSARSR